MATNATTASELSLSDIAIIDSEPRIADLRIAERLGFGRPRDIRKLIERNLPELEGFGEVRATVAQTSLKGGRPAGREYHLNEGQTLLVCMLARTPQAATIRREVIDVYMTFRHQRQCLQCLSAETTWRDGTGMVIVGGELIQFDDKVMRIEDGDPVVVLVDRGANNTPQLAVIKASIGPDPYRDQRHGFRTIKCQGRMVDIPVDPRADTNICLALGRVISRTPVDRDGGVA